MKKQRWFGFIGHTRKHLAVWGCAGLVLATVFILCRGRKDNPWPNSPSIPLMASNGPGSSIPMNMPWYLRSGQWRADMRSIGALLRYLTDAEQIAQTNPVPVKAEISSDRFG
jgi:hypothetical protein